MLLSPVDGNCSEHSSAKSHLCKTRLAHHIRQRFGAEKVFGGGGQVGIIRPAPGQPLTKRGDDQVHMHPDQRCEQIAGGPGRVENDDAPTGP